MILDASHPFRAASNITDISRNIFNIVEKMEKDENKKELLRLLHDLDCNFAVLLDNLDNLLF